MAGAKGRSGRRPKPTSQLKREGGYCHSRHKNRADLIIAPAKLDPPERLSEIGREAWQRITETLDPSLVTHLDVDSLGAYCDCLEAYHGARGQYLANPTDKDVRIAFYACLDHLDKIGRQFGWTPQSRAGIHAPGDDEGGSMFDDLLSRLGGSN